MKKQSQHMSNDNSTQRILKPKMLQHQQKKSSISSTINNPTNNNINKIMLTDLCPQQKAKIGQLIKTLQQRKQQNQQLTQQLTAYKLNFIELQKLNKQIQLLLTEKTTQIQKLTQQLQQKNNQLISKDISIHQLEITLEKYQQLSKLTQLKISYGVGTDEVIRANKQTQTKQKKGKKLKDHQVQVDTLIQIANIKQQNQQNKKTNSNKYSQPNSRSFEKIMRDNQLLSAINLNNRQFKQQLNKSQQYGSQTQQYEKQKQSSGNRGYFGDYDHQRQKGQFIQQEDITVKNNIQARSGDRRKKQPININQSINNNNNNWSHYSSSSCDPTFSQQHPLHQQQLLSMNPPKSGSINRNQIQVEDTQNDDDQFQMLARKWMQLKEKNIQQLSQGWMMESGRESFGNYIHQRNNNSNIKNCNNSNNMGNNSYRNRQLQQQQQRVMLEMQSKIKSNKRRQRQFMTKTDTNINANNSHSIINNNRKSKFQELKEEQYQNTQLLDQVQLNRALKSKDFSASRLLNNSKSKISNINTSNDNSNNKLSSQHSERKRSLQKSKLNINRSKQQQKRKQWKFIDLENQQKYKATNNKRPVIENSNKTFLTTNINKNVKYPNNHNNHSPYNKQKNIETKSPTFYNSQLLDLVQEINK